MFGSDLSAICEQEGSDVPSFLVHFMEYIEKCGLNVASLYRYSSKGDQVQKLRSMIDKGNCSSFVVVVVFCFHDWFSCLFIFIILF